MTRPLSDTTPAAAGAQAAAHRRLTGVERLAIAVDMSMAARALAKARLEEENPDWTEWDVHRELLRSAFFPDNLPSALR